MGHHEIREQLVDRHVALNRQAFILRGALLAQMLLDLFAAFDFGEMNRRVFPAVITLHAQSPRRAKAVNRWYFGWAGSSNQSWQVTANKSPSCRQSPTLQPNAAARLAAIATTGLNAAPHAPSMDSADRTAPLH